MSVNALRGCSFTGRTVLYSHVFKCTDEASPGVTRRQSARTLRLYFSDVECFEVNKSTRNVCNSVCPYDEERDA